MVQWLRLHPPNVRGPGLRQRADSLEKTPMLGDISHVATKRTGLNDNQRSCVPQLRPGRATLIYNFFFKFKHSRKCLVFGPRWCHGVLHPILCYVLGVLCYDRKSFWIKTFLAVLRSIRLDCFVWNEVEWLEWEGMTAGPFRGVSCPDLAVDASCSCAWTVGLSSPEDGLHFPPLLRFHSLNEAGLPVVAFLPPIFSFLKFLIEKHSQQIDS